MSVDVGKQMSELNETREELEARTREIRQLQVLEYDRKELQQKRDEILRTIEHQQRLAERPEISMLDRKQHELRIEEFKNALQKTEAQLAEKQRIIDQISATIERNKHFDKYFVFQNIRERLKTVDVKLGQIEKEAGCQPGYMSRLDKPDSATDPTVEFIITAALMLGVSVDVLLNVPLAEITPTELYLISFLEKLVRDTDADKLTWIKEAADELRSILLDDEGDAEHPLFWTYDTMDAGFNGEMYPERHVYFHSRAYGKETEIAGDGYHLRLKNNAMLYLMKIKRTGTGGEDSGNSIIEVWLHPDRSAASYLCSSDNHESIAKLVTNLYSAVAQNNRHPKVQDSTRYIIDAFMRDDFSNDPIQVSTDELPF